MTEGSAGIHVEPGVVRFQDVDAAGVVFFARVFDYFHDAYVSFLRSRGIPLDVALSERAWAAPLRHAEADYLRPLRFGDSFTVSLVEVDVEETEFRIGYRIERGSEAACVGRTRHVSVDPKTFRRTAIPGAVRRALAAPG